MPWDALKFVPPVGIGKVAVVGTRFALFGKKVTPGVISGAAPVSGACGIFDDNAIVEAARYIAGLEVHFPDIGAPVALVSEILNPGALVSPIVETIGACIVGEHTREYGGTRGRTSGSGAMGVVE